MEEIIILPQDKETKVQKEEDSSKYRIAQSFTRIASTPDIVVPLLDAERKVEIEKNDGFFLDSLEPTQREVLEGLVMFLSEKYSKDETFKKVIQDSYKDGRPPKEIDELDPTKRLPKYSPPVVVNVQNLAKLTRPDIESQRSRTLSEISSVIEKLAVKGHTLGTLWEDCSKDKGLNKKKRLGVWESAPLIQLGQSAKDKKGRYLSVEVRFHPIFYFQLGNRFNLRTYRVFKLMLETKSSTNHDIFWKLYDSIDTERGNKISKAKNITDPKEKEKVLTYRLQLDRLLSRLPEYVRAKSPREIKRRVLSIFPRVSDDLLFIGEIDRPLEITPEGFIVVHFAEDIVEDITPIEEKTLPE